MKESEKERIKLLAAFLNGLAIATVTLGFVSPLVVALYGLVNAPPAWKAMLYGSGWLMLGGALHTLAEWYLGDLDE